jgi:PhnB protein
MSDETAAVRPQTPPAMEIGLTPYLTIRDGRGQEAMRFYATAFGASEVFRNMADDGKRVLHGRLLVNGALVFLSDDFREMRGGAEAPPAAGVTLHLQVDDADAWAERAKGAGAEIFMPVAEMFWGDRYGQLRDPFGHSWSIGSTPKR